MDENTEMVSGLASIFRYSLRFLHECSVEDGERLSLLYIVECVEVWRIW